MYLRFIHVIAHFSILFLLSIHFVAHKYFYFFYSFSNFILSVAGIWGFPVSHIVIYICYCLSLLIPAVLIDVKWYLFVVLFCISLKTNHSKHIFMCLLAIYSLEDCLFKAFALHFQSRLLVFLLLSCKSSLCILNQNPFLR